MTAGGESSGELRASGKGVTIVGGGLAGLTAAAWLAREGVEVDLFEGSATLGGRASTLGEKGYRLNLGPHALYRLGAARRVFSDLGLDPASSPPATRGLMAQADGRLYGLPKGVGSLLTTGLLDFGSKMHLAAFLGKLAQIDAREWHGRPTTAWIDSISPRPGVRRLLRGLARLSTYCADLDRLDAAAMIDQLKLAVAGNVLYLDHGWSVLVDGLAERALRSGARLHAGVKVDRLQMGAGAAGVVLADGQEIPAAATILAVAPATVSTLLERSGAQPAEALRGLRPIRAAVLDLGLRRLPRPELNFVLGLDRADYLSVHSATAKLAPEGGALVHVARYLGDDSATAPDVRAELEMLLDAAQPGWRNEVEVERFLPEVVVSHGLWEAERARPAIDTSGVDGVFLAGDWVGDEGMLVDAAVASAVASAERALERAKELRAA